MRELFTGGTYQPSGSKVAYGPRLTESNGTYTLQWSDGSKGVFLSTDDGRLSYLENARGHRLVFTYSSTKKPLSGTSPFAASASTPLTVAELEDRLDPVEHKSLFSIPAKPDSLRSALADPRLTPVAAGLISRRLEFDS